VPFPQRRKCRARPSLSAEKVILSTAYRSIDFFGKPNILEGLQHHFPLLGNQEMVEDK
jgi:hypothetical protein